MADYDGFDSGTNDYSLSIWVYSEDFDATSAQELFDKNAASAGPVLEVTTAGKVLYTHATDTLTSDTALTNGAWNHIVVTLNSANELHMYINGVQDINSTASVTATIDSPGVIAYFGDNSGVKKFAGTIAQFMWVEKELTPREVGFLYNNGSGRNNFVYTDWNTGKIGPDITGTVITRDSTLSVIKTDNNATAESFKTATGTVVLTAPGGVWGSALTESVVNRQKLSNRLKGLIVKLGISSSAGKRTRFQLVKLFYRIFEKSL
jgi:hypothetical protein